MKPKLRCVWVAMAASAVFMGVALAHPTGGMGPGMMGGCDGYGAFGMGSGMMGGFGAETMGPGAMFGRPDTAFAGLALTQDQRKKIADIREEASKAMWELMGNMHRQGYHMWGMYGQGADDEAAARKSFQAMNEAQKAMFELQLESRRKIEAVLTNEQREKLRKHWIDR